MKMNCPICNRQVQPVNKNETIRIYECFNQCLRITHLNDDNKTIRGYTLRVNMDGKDYIFKSNRVDFLNNENKVSSLKVYGQTNDGYGYSTIATLEQFFTIEEVFPDPKRVVKRLLNLRVFT